MKKIRLIISRIVRGCGYLEGYGNHPGTLFLGLFLVLLYGSALQGIISAGTNIILGLLFATCLSMVLVIPYLWGAYDRAKSYDEKNERTMNND